MVDTMMVSGDPDDDSVETRAVGKMTGSGYRWVAVAFSRKILFDILTILHSFI